MLRIATRSGSLVYDTPFHRLVKGEDNSNEAIRGAVHAVIPFPPCNYRPMASCQIWSMIGQICRIWGISLDFLSAEVMKVKARGFMFCSEQQFSAWHHLVVGDREYVVRGKQTPEFEKPNNQTISNFEVLDNVLNTIGALRFTTITLNWGRCGPVLLHLAPFIASINGFIHQRCLKVQVTWISTVWWVYSSEGPLYLKMVNVNQWVQWFV